MLTLWSCSKFRLQFYGHIWVLWCIVTVERIIIICLTVAFAFITHTCISITFELFNDFVTANIYIALLHHLLQHLYCITAYTERIALNPVHTSNNVEATLSTATSRTILSTKSNVASTKSNVASILLLVCTGLYTLSMQFWGPLLFCVHVDKQNRTIRKWVPIIYNYKYKNEILYNVNGGRSKTAKIIKNKVMLPTIMSSECQCQSWTDQTADWSGRAQMN